MELGKFQCTERYVFIEHYCTNLKKRLVNVISRQMEKKFHNDLLPSSTSSTTDSVIASTNDTEWSAWDYVKPYFIYVLVGMIVFFVCVFYVRNTRVCRTIRLCRTHDPENVVQWWCYGNFK